MPSVTGLALASERVSDVKTMPALASAKRGRMRKLTQGWTTPSMRSMGPSVPRLSRSISSTIVCASSSSPFSIASRKS